MKSTIIRTLKARLAVAIGHWNNIKTDAASRLVVDSLQIYHASLAREVEHRWNARDTAAELVQDAASNVHLQRAKLRDAERELNTKDKDFDTLSDHVIGENLRANATLDALERFEATLAGVPRVRPAPPASAVPVVVHVGKQAD